MLKLDEPFRDKDISDIFSLFQQFRFGFQEQKIFISVFVRIFSIGRNFSPFRLSYNICNIFL